MKNEVVYAAGHLRPQQRTLHCHDVPSDHVCVMVTKAVENVRAPLVLGDIEENSFLEKGKILLFQKDCSAGQDLDKTMLFALIL